MEGVLEVTGDRADSLRGGAARPQVLGAALPVANGPKADRSGVAPKR